MKRIALALAFSLISSAAFAACPATLTIKDAAGSPVTAQAVFFDDGSGNCIPRVKDSDVVAAINAQTPGGANLIGNTGLVLPAGSTPIQATATGTTAATTATMAADATQFNFICGYSIRANATAAATGNATVTGLATSPLNFTQWTAPNASGLGISEQLFVPCQPSSAINTAIAVVSAAPGTGGVVSVTVWGFKKVASP